ncbi:MAG: DMT family transporter [Oscillospiraceae bacterium]|nr:DMT family transporter [Oscillospiraceae bacterium]MBR4194087.1 DMT family transporter [Oscillospiraceae bacterium]
MLSGILAAVTWALETVIIGIALAMSPLVNSLGEAIFLAPFISTFLHDACSAVFSWIYNGARGKLGGVFHALFRTRSGKWVVIAAIIGGPVGMTGYVMAVTYMGASIAAIASAIFPAIGSVLACIFLKEKMKWYQWLFLALTILGVYGLSYSTELAPKNYLLGILGALLCAFGWGIEAVILAKCLKDPEVTDEYALQIRQTTSAIFYGAALLPILGLMGFREGGLSPWAFTAGLFRGTGWLLPTIAIAGLFATLSYLFYYKAIARIGASKAMALNITYTAWAMIFALIYDLILHALDASHEIAYPSVLTLICALVVLVCSIFAAADFRELFKRDA